MPRQLDLTALRSFLAITEMGGVTRAAQQLNLTQSAASLQIKRLETFFGQPLFVRSGRGLVLTAQGERLVGLARRMLEANDETLARMSAGDFSGEVWLGVPDDLLYPRVPRAMRAFADDYPGVKVHLRSAQTRTLREEYVGGTLDLILTTEAERGAGSELLVAEPLVWIGAPGGRAWQRRPLPLATVANCIFNKAAIESLSASKLDWKIEVDNVSNSAVEASTRRIPTPIDDHDTLTPPQLRSRAEFAEAAAITEPPRRLRDRALSILPEGKSMPRALHGVPQSSRT